MFGILAVNGWHNVVHIVARRCSPGRRRSSAGARTLLRSGIGAPLHRCSPLWGFIDRRRRSILGLVPVNNEDNVLHLILGLTGLAAGAATPKPRPPSPA